MVYGTKATKAAATTYKVDIPACPHKYLDLDALSDQNESDWRTLGLGPVGFSLSGVPILPPFTTDLIPAHTSSTETRDR